MSYLRPLTFALTGLCTANTLPRLHIQLASVRRRTYVRIAMWTAHHALTIPLQRCALRAHRLALRHTHWHPGTRFIDTFNAHKLTLLIAGARYLIARIATLTRPTTFVIQQMTKLTCRTLSLFALGTLLDVITVRNTSIGPAAH